MDFSFVPKNFSHFVFVQRWNVGGGGSRVDVFWCHEIVKGDMIGFP